MAKIIIPTPLRKFTDNQASVETESDTVLGSIQALTDKFPELKQAYVEKQIDVFRNVLGDIGDVKLEKFDSNLFCLE